jgi:hypothetical protein
MAFLRNWVPTTLHATQVALSKETDCLGNLIKLKYLNTQVGLRSIQIRPTSCSFVGKVAQIEPSLYFEEKN